MKFYFKQFFSDNERRDEETFAELKVTPSGYPKAVV